MSLLEVRGLHFSVPTRPVLTGLDITVDHGEIHALVGANGSGKSTLAYLIMGCEGYLEAHGYEADGFVADVGKLVVAGIPAIALVKENGYFHFVVIKGMRDGRVLIGDPSVGTRAMPQRKFHDIWVNRILFVIRNKIEMASFNAEADWRAAPRGPIEGGIYRGAAESMFAKRGPSDF